MARILTWGIRFGHAGLRDVDFAAWVARGVRSSAVQSMVSCRKGRILKMERSTICWTGVSFLFFFFYFLLLLQKMVVSGSWAFCLFVVMIILGLSLKRSALVACQESLLWLMIRLVEDLFCLLLYEASLRPDTSPLLLLPFPIFPFPFFPLDSKKGSKRKGEKSEEGAGQKSGQRYITNHWLLAVMDSVHIYTAAWSQDGVEQHSDTNPVMLNVALRR